MQTIAKTLVVGVLILTCGQTEARQKTHTAVELLDSAAAKAKLPKALLRAIASVESTNNPNKINRRTWDYGLMQVNHRTAAAYGHLPAEMLDPAKNIAVSVKLLKSYQKRFGHEEMWECRYNLGTARQVSKWDSCRVYFDKLVKAGYRKSIAKGG